MARKTPRPLARLAFLALLAAAPAPSPPGPAALLAAIQPGLLHDPVRKYLLKPYAEATQTLLADPAWNGQDLDALKTLAPHLVLVDGKTLAAGCHSGQFRKLDWGRLDRDRYVPPATADCGAGAYLTATALAWDRDKFSTPPQWSDLWDIARHPGRRGLQTGARGNLEIALMADGVSPADIYRTLRSAEGVDRAFRKLDQLKPFIQWWDQPTQPAQWLAAGKVLLTSAPTLGLTASGNAARKHLAWQPTGSLLATAFFAIPRAAPNASVAAMALELAADPARQALLSTATGATPALREAAALLPTQDPLTTTLASTLPPDEDFWADNGAKLEQRFTAWLQKK